MGRFFTNILMEEDGECVSLRLAEESIRCHLTYQILSKEASYKIYEYLILSTSRDDHGNI